MDDRYDLQRFVDAQNPVIERVLAELRTGRKRSHWMWFVFPQIAGLGNSEMNRRYAIASRDEAAAYLKHPVLGPRLRDCTRLVNLVQGSTAHQIFGSPDDMKFCSSMTLFSNLALPVVAGRCQTRANFGSVTSSVTASNTTFTGAPIRRLSVLSTRLLTTTGPSCSRIRLTRYGSSFL